MMSQASVGVDFTLETVQYKFASIIGELCGKPSVLSQFAIWLDLRLSEYKLKGSISLDCSGMKPNPDWLQGLKDPVPIPPTPSYVNQQPPREPAARAKPQSRRPSNVRSSDMIVKQEPIDSYSGEQIHFPENNSVQRIHNDRKRVSDSPMFSPTKSRRISSTPPRISQENSSDSTYLTSQDQSGIMDSAAASGFQIPTNIDNESMLGRGDNPPDIAYTRTDNSMDMYTSANLTTDSEDNLKNFSSTNEDNQALTTDTAKSTVPLSTKVLTDMPGNPNRRAPVDTIKNTFSAVKVLQNWLGNLPTGVYTPILNIDPADLDSYLAQFFAVVKNRQGGDYHPLSFNALRSCLERYLQHHNYPYSIVKSSQFSSSRATFKRRMSELQERWKQQQALKMSMGRFGTQENDQTINTGEFWNTVENQQKPDMARIKTE